MWNGNFNNIIRFFSNIRKWSSTVAKFGSQKPKDNYKFNIFFQTDNHNHKQVIDFRTDMRIIVKSKPWEEYYLALNCRLPFGFDSDGKMNDL